MIDLDATAKEYREASHYWQKQWDAVTKQAKERENELIIQLKLTQQQWDAEHQSMSDKLERLERELKGANRLIEQVREALGGFNGTEDEMLKTIYSLSF